MTEMQNSDGMSTRIYSAEKVAEFENLFVNTVLMDQWFAKFIELTKDSTSSKDIAIHAFLRSTPGHGDRIYRMPYLAPTAALFAMRYGPDVDPKSPYSQGKDMELVKKVLKENMEKEAAIIEAIQKKIDDEKPGSVVASYFRSMLESLQDAAEVWTATETGQ
ncbi:hypothetical protein [Sneathiella sp.]|uniref:hypothetical protein n=1 Tax=Sneathiella sp. TaxID=1964365 RepID=UPI0026354A72|nr:hypothetical protein [Sneathiella sp.]MDF2365654.1 hypothetical protein [Sneathiella sp.]